MFNPETIKEEEADVDALAPIESPVAFMGGMGSSTRTSGKYEGFGNTAKDREGINSALQILMYLYVIKVTYLL